MKFKIQVMFLFPLGFPVFYTSSRLRKSAGELQMCKPPNGWMGEWVDSTRMLNLMTAFGYTFVAPPKCLSAESHLFFALRIPRTAAPTPSNMAEI